ncbi:Eco57I restriction-modification methylase domain-containing protein [Paenibacillus odorifer]|uniref:Eco57I restriction-modification methylase domain-containing protein n=1 Tax=Paenibacillus odorifer TaxID=189426 RepID=UPI00289F5468|nr:Eco57I restriction-modification methylase domain-containing protein [Paenibacillus odorifer]
MLTMDKKNELLSELLLTQVNVTRQQVSKATEKKIKSNLGQFFTEPRLALFMSSMFEIDEPHIRLLDPGAGIGILTTATIAQICRNEKKPSSIDVTAVEIDATLLEHLQISLESCRTLCVKNNIQFTYSIIHDDFIKYGSTLLNTNTEEKYNKIILNPPYKKISSKSETRVTLREIGIETTNLYSAFVAISKRLLIPNGELVAITPRSFCNGTYFKPFRVDFLNDMRFRKIHLFNSRTDSFRDDDVLQENIIYHAIKDLEHKDVIISFSENINEESSTQTLEYNKLVHPNDEDKFIRILRDEEDLRVKLLMEGITTTLEDLGIKVSTGRVVDFRTKNNLRSEPNDSTVPLIYPVHFQEGSIKWPIFPADKPNAILLNEETNKQLVPKGNYVLVKRFSPKEETRRITTAIYKEDQMNTEFVGFENHLNYFHLNGQGLPLDLAKGLAIYLSSSIVDCFFRQFNGHTQVNVGDLKSLPYPPYEIMIKMGAAYNDRFPKQHEIDNIVSDLLETE